MVKGVLMVSVLLTVGRAGVLSSRAIALGELEELLRLLGPLAEPQRTNLKRASDIVLVEGRHPDALTPAQFTALDHPIAWTERIAGLTLDPWQRDVLLSAAPRLLLNATRQSGKSTTAALEAAWTVLQGGLAVVVSPSLRQSGFLFRKLARHLVASGAPFRRETMTEVELVAGGLAVSLPGDRPAMLRGLSLRHEGPA